MSTPKDMESSLNAILKVCQDQRMDPSEKLTLLSTAVLKNQTLNVMYTAHNKFKKSLEAALSDIDITISNFENNMFTLPSEKKNLANAMLKICNIFVTYINKAKECAKAMLFGRDAGDFSAWDKDFKTCIEKGVISGVKGLGLQDPVLDYFKTRPIPFSNQAARQHNAVFLSLLLYYWMNFGGGKGHFQSGGATETELLKDAQMCEWISDAMKKVTDMVQYVPQSYRKMLPVSMQKLAEKSQAKHVNLYQTLVRNIKANMIQVLPKVQGFMAQLDAQLKRALGPIPPPFNQLPYHHLDLLLLYRMQMADFESTQKLLTTAQFSESELAQKSLFTKIDEIKSMIPQLKRDGKQIDKIVEKYVKLQNNKRFQKLNDLYTTTVANFNTLADAIGKAWGKMFVPYARKNINNFDGSLKMENAFKDGEAKELFCGHLVELLNAYGKFLVGLGITKQFHRYFPEITQPVGALDYLLKNEGLGLKELHENGFVATGGAGFDDDEVQGLSPFGGGGCGEWNA